MTPVITDHVLVRYLERVVGMDLDKVRAEIAAVVQPFVDCKAMHAVHGPFWLVLDGVKVITITEQKPKVKAAVMHDRGKTNGTEKRDGPMHWKGQARRRNHK